MAILCGWASIDENGKIRGGKAGDQTGREVKTGNWYDFGQTTVLRWKHETFAKAYARVIKSLCNNSNIGYDQNQRTSLYTALKKVNWDCNKITTKVECDCSELVACAVNCVLGKAVISSAVYTGNLNDALVSTGYFNKLTGTKYCDSDKYLAVGDVVNKPGSHVISVLENGSKVGVTSASEGKNVAAEPTLRKGSTGSEVKKLQKNLNKLKVTDADGDKLAVDGDFGTSTREAVKKFQKKYGLEVDGIYGAKSYKKMKSLLEK